MKLDSRGIAPQTLPCAGAHFQSRSLLHTSLAPPAIIQPAGAGVSYGLRAGCACPPTCVGGSVAAELQRVGTFASAFPTVNQRANLTIFQRPILTSRTD